MSDEHDEIERQPISKRGGYTSEVEIPLPEVPAGPAPGGGGSSASTSDSGTAASDE